MFLICCQACIDRVGPADLLKPGRDLGFVPGDLADLVTYHDDPRDDPAILKQPAAIIRRGTRIR